MHHRGALCLATPYPIYYAASESAPAVLCVDTRGQAGHDAASLAGRGPLPFISPGQIPRRGSLNTRTRFIKYRWRVFPADVIY
jgi:hypothetical protein